METIIRRLESDDAAAYRALRLEALATCPSAFGAAWHEEAALDLAQVQERLEEAPVFGAFIAGALCGVAGFRARREEKKRHKGELWGVYVRPDVRGRGIGQEVVAHVIAHAQRRVEQLHATVVTCNHAARRLYLGLGFVVYGTEPRALKVDGRTFDQEHMVLLFERG